MQLKFTPPQGTVTVAIQRDGEAWVQISVADTGPGIPAAEAEKIFEKFYQLAQARQAENTRDRAGPGDCEGPGGAARGKDLGGQ